MFAEPCPTHLMHPSYADPDKQESRLAHHLLAGTQKSWVLGNVLHLLPHKALCSSLPASPSITPSHSNAPSQAVETLKQFRSEGPMRLSHFNSPTIQARTSMRTIVSEKDD